MNTHLGGNPTAVQEKCRSYLSDRIGTYEFRCRRYAGVESVLLDLGMRHSDSVCDLGAGDQMLERYLREQQWSGDYLPVDGSIDGTNLETFVPVNAASWFVAIEVLEHLHNWERLLEIMKRTAWNGCVVTVPNPAAVDVLGCDPTHVSVITAAALIDLGWKVKTASFFDVPNDTIVAWW